MPSNAPIRIIVAGMGLRGAWGLAAIRDSGQYRIVGLVDAIPARAHMMASELGLQSIACFTDLKDALAKLDADAVAIFTPDGTHADLAVPALDAGKFVFVEKPLEITESKLREFLDADQSAGGQTFVGLNLRYAPLYLKVRELLEHGVAGRILTTQADEFYDGGRTYFRRWNRLSSMSGGLWITKACHDFDLLYWLVGTEPQSVYATCSLDYYRPRADAAEYCRDCALLPDCPDRYEAFMPPQSLGGRLATVTEQATGRRADLCLYNSEKDTFDHGVATIVFADGAIATYTLNVVAGFTNRRLRVGGTRATIDADLASGRITIFRRDPSSEETMQVGLSAAAHGGADERIFPAFADFVRRRSPAPMTPTEAAVSVRIGLAARRSCNEREVVHVRHSAPPPNAIGAVKLK